MCRFPAVPGSAAGEHTQQAHPMFFKKRQRPVIQHICGSQRGFHRIKLSQRHFAVGINERLLVSDILDRSDVKGVLARMGGFDFTDERILLFLFLQCNDLRFSEHESF